ncbi:hypothetical protein F5Y19DRAFT_26557 [Xylariaceae sp. FL1651]|nr:hypothetical protein F5Y19DRAFT_26557 [Xylariaceae sp. FL1651]
MLISAMGEYARKAHARGIDVAGGLLLLHTLLHAYKNQRLEMVWKFIVSVVVLVGLLKLVIRGFMVLFR